MKSAIALLIQFSIVAAVGFGVWYLLRVSEERASNTAPATQGEGEIQPAGPAETPAPPAGKSEPESLAKEEHVPPDFS